MAWSNMLRTERTKNTNGFTFSFPLLPLLPPKPTRARAGDSPKESPAAAWNLAVGTCELLPDQLGRETWFSDEPCAHTGSSASFLANADAAEMLAERRRGAAAEYARRGELRVLVIHGFWRTFADRAMHRRRVGHHF